MMIMMLCYVTLYPGCCCFGSYLRVPYFLVFSSPFSILFSTLGRLISIAVPVFASCLLLERLQQVLVFCEQRHVPGLRLHTYRGGTESASPKSLSFSKNKIWRAVQRCCKARERPLSWLACIQS